MNTEPTTRTEADAVADIALAASEPHALSHEPVVFLGPAGAEVHTVDPERFQPVRRRRRGVVNVTTVDGLNVLLHRYTDSDTVLYTDVTTRRIVAVFNDHPPTGEHRDAGGWQDHRAQLHLAHTEEWQRWVQRSGQLMDQATFAEFLDANVDDITEPDGATMLELAQTFQATTQANFRASRDLRSGQVQLNYHEDVEASGGRDGSMVIPAEFKVALRPWEGADRFAVTAKFRYRQSSGRLTLGFHLHRPDLVIAQAFEDTVAAIDVDGLGVPRVEGRAPGADD